MANYSDIFPISGGGGGTIQGLPVVNHTASFNAVIDTVYEVNTDAGDVIVSLPTTPPDGSSVWIIYHGANDCSIVTSEKFNGVVPALDYGKTLTSKLLLFKLSYANSVTGWTWESIYNGLLVDAYLGSGTLLTYSSTGSLNGLVNWLGTSGNTTSFVNPIPSLLTISSVNYSGGTSVVNSPTNATDKNTATLAAPRVSSGGASADITFELDLPSGSSIVPSTIAISITDEGSGGWTLSIRGITTDNEEIIFTSVSIGNFSDGWRIFTYQGSTAFKKFIFRGAKFHYASVAEVEVWGLYYG